MIDLNLNTFFGKWHKLVVCKGSEVPPSTLMDKIVQEMRTALANTTFTFPGDYKFSIQTAWTQIFPVLHRLYHSVLCDASLTQLYLRVRNAVHPLAAMLSAVLAVNEAFGFEPRTSSGAYGRILSTVER